MYTNELIKYLVSTGCKIRPEYETTFSRVAFNEDDDFAFIPKDEEVADELVIEICTALEIECPTDELEELRQKYIEEKIQRYRISQRFSGNETY